MDFGVYTPEVQEIMDAAMHGPLPYDRITRLPLHTRCRLIRHMTDAILARETVSLNNLDVESLSSISKSFAVSDHYVAWHDRQTKRLLQRLKEKAHRVTLNTIRHWDHASATQRRDALRETTRVHQRTFMQGLASPLPITHTFSARAPRRYADGISLLFGTFNGSLKTGRGRIWQNIHPLASFHDSLEALDTAHHEMDHAIHFSLAYEFHRGRIRRDHPLYEDACYFHAVEIRKAGIPPTLTQAYLAQTFEGLAAREGKAIATGIYALAL